MNIIKKIKNRIKKKNFKEGFTLIESLIAITILMISVATPMSLAYSGLLAAYLAEDQIVAYYLAEDAIEYIRNKRDYNKLESTTNILDDIFDTCLVTPTTGVSDTGIDDNPDENVDKGCNLSTFSTPNNSNILAYNHGGSNLYYYSDTGAYHNESTFNGISGTETKFSRQVRIGYINAALTEARVEVIIRWPNTVGTIQKFRLAAHLTDW